MAPQVKKPFHATFDLCCSLRLECPSHYLCQNQPNLLGFERNINSFLKTFLFLSVKINHFFLGGFKCLQKKNSFFLNTYDRLCSGSIESVYYSLSREGSLRYLCVHPTKTLWCMVAINTFVISSLCYLH